MSYYTMMGFTRTYFGSNGYYPPDPLPNYMPIIGDMRTLMNPDASMGSKILAGVGLAMTVVPGEWLLGAASKGLGAAEGSALRAESSLQGSLLAQQLGAEQIAGARMPSGITGYGIHGLDRAISRDGVGVSVRAMSNAVNSPVGVFGKSNGTFGFVGQEATVILNSRGSVVTTCADNSLGIRISF